MKSVLRYQCENCGKLFKSQSQCELHEEFVCTPNSVLVRKLTYHDVGNLPAEIHVLDENDGTVAIYEKALLTYNKDR